MPQIPSRQHSPNRKQVEHFQGAFGPLQIQRNSFKFNCFGQNGCSGIKNWRSFLRIANHRLGVWRIGLGHLRRNRRNLQLNIRAVANTRWALPIHNRNSENKQNLESSEAAAGDHSPDHHLLLCANEAELWVTLTCCLLVQCWTFPTGDLNFTNGLSVRNSKLIAHLFAVQPEAASLYHFVKEWIVAHGLTYLKGYTLTLLVVFYLQNKRLMPSVENVQQGLPKQIIGSKQNHRNHLLTSFINLLNVSGWEAQFNPERNLADYRIQRIESYKPHISVFFRFYSTFDYSWVMSTFRGFAIDSATYGERYPEFRMQGILIPGPCNKATNCGVMRDDLRDQFIKLCAASAEFFNHCSCWNRSNR